MSDKVVFGIKVLAAVLVMSAVSAGVSAVVTWRGDSIELETLKPAHERIVAERDAKSGKVLELTESNAELKASIKQQNHALELAAAQAKSAKDQQELAQAFALKQAAQRDRRIAALEADLADASKTITDLLNTSWSQHHDQ